MPKAVTDRDDLIVRLWEESRRYFSACARREPLLGPDDVDDLAAQTLEKMIPKLDGLIQPEHYLRRVMRNLVTRELKRRRRLRNLTVSMEDAALDQILTVEPDPGSDLSDGELRLVETARRVLRREDPVTRRMVACRCAATSWSYARIAQDTGVGCAALRMRMARFGGRVRAEVEEPNQAR